MLNLMRVTLPWACFGLEYEQPGGVTVGLDFKQGIITGAAPIAKWCEGRPVKEIERYWRLRGAEIQHLQVDVDGSWTSTS